MQLLLSSYLLLTITVSPLTFNNSPLKYPKNELFGGDKIPSQGLAIVGENGKEIVRIVSSSVRPTHNTISMDTTLPGRATGLHPTPHNTISIDTTLPGWGTGLHPTTYMCIQILPLLPSPHSINTVVDYGCGSGILAIASNKILPDVQSTHCVDIEETALSSTESNYEANLPDVRPPALLHAREIVPGVSLPQADLLFANILVGALCRPSMVASIVSSLSPGSGIVCFSGIRPGEVGSVREAYGRWIDFDDGTVGGLNGVMSGGDIPGSVENYNFDVKEWARLLGRRKGGDDSFVELMSDAAVS